MTDLNNEKGALTPKRERTPPGQGQPQVSQMTDEERQQAADEIINNAPLRSTDESSTNAPAVVDVKPTRKLKKVKPWRVGFEGNSPDELMQISTKTSINQPKELELRLAYIANELNMSRGFGKKVFVRDLMIRALDIFTREELAKLGHDVD
ncbi:hypothetical protein ACNAUY_08360 [Acinetobacter tibetensis]|uniref:hypothetical protein n=1 Tax=Acinetobacter tibetensis TaxID=2943497 RepID=UPI003A4D1D49